MGVVKVPGCEEQAMYESTHKQGQSVGRRADRERPVVWAAHTRCTDGTVRGCEGESGAVSRR